MRLNVFGVLLILIGFAVLLGTMAGGEWFDILVRLWPVVFVLRAVHNWERDDQTKSFQVGQMLLGGALMYDNFAPLPVTADIYKWWPVLLIFLGLDMLLRTDRNCCQATVKVNGRIRSGKGVPVNLHLVRELPSEAVRGSVDIEFNAGILNVGGRTPHFFEGNINSTFAEPDVDFKPGTITAVRIDQSIAPHATLSGNENRWSLSFTDTIPLEFKVEANAGVADLDLSAYKAEKVNIEGNAGKVSLRLGRLVTRSEVCVEVNAGKLTLMVPSDIYVSARGEAHLASMDLSSAGLVKTGSDWIQPGFESAEKTVTIKFEANLSSLEVVRY